MHVFDFCMTIASLVVPGKAVFTHESHPLPQIPAQIPVGNIFIIPTSTPTAMTPTATTLTATTPTATTPAPLSPRQFSHHASCHASCHDSSSSSSSNACSSPSVAAKAGIGVGVTLSVLLIAVLLFYLIRRRRQKKNAEAGVLEIQDMRQDGTRRVLEGEERCRRKVRGAFGG
ncbi:hypothetical protein BDV97DRAFT_362671 [Delphinella strobiligena]|nr:hypothetical protein BDV97DRAFT_362671 [Delphinella strobiligena]